MLNFFKKRQVNDWDLMVINQLRKAGSDLSKEHIIDFFLYFPTETAANQAAIFAEESYRDKVKVTLSAKPDVGKNNYLLEINRKMIPTVFDLYQIRGQFNEISQRFGGEYDGWGAEVVK